MTNDLMLQRAIANNNDIYREVFEAHDISSQITEDAWYSTQKAPPLYSNLITRSRHWRPDTVFSEIGSNAEKGRWDSWSIKDSFASLDLTEQGFEKLFAARWMYLESEKFEKSTETTGLRYIIVTTEKELAAWRLAWNKNEKDENLAEQIYTDVLLDNPRMFFISGYDRDALVSGCIVNRTERVLGVSNFFSPAPGVAYWSDLISFIFSAIEKADIANYERDLEVRTQLCSLGFEEVGDLIVWLKKPI